MKSMKFILSAIIGGLLLISTTAIEAAKPTLNMCPCWLEGEDNGMAAALLEINVDVTKLAYVFDRKPDDISTFLEIGECIYTYPPLDPPPEEECQHIFVEVDWLPSEDDYKCTVRVYEYGYTDPWEPVSLPLASDIELKACLSGARLLWQTAKEYQEFGE